MNTFYKKQIIFRCDASPEIGSGHVMRCLTLADALAERGHDCTFMCSEETLRSIPALGKGSYIILNPDSPPEEVDVLIIDHYGLDRTFETRCRVWARRIVVIDDLANRPHDCDILLDQTFGRDAEDYKKLVPRHCTILTGSQYALLRPQFATMRRRALTRREVQKGKIKRVLISPGSTNIHNIASKILRAFKEIQDIHLEVDIVLGSNALYVNEVKDLVVQMNDKDTHQVNLHLDVQDMASLMMQADLAIGAGGTTSWERCCLGLPTLLVVLADNQEATSTVLAEKGAAVNMGYYDVIQEENISHHFYRLYNAPKSMIKMSENSANICDGKGVQRLAPYIIKPINGISLQLMTAEDCNTLYEWQSQPGARTFSRNSAVPTMSEHKIWFDQVLENPDRALYKIIKDEMPIGMLRIDRNKKTDRQFEISILIDKTCQGQGVAANALEFIRRLEPEADFIAEILPGNTISERLFLKSGYKNFEGTLYKQKGSL